MELFIGGAIVSIYLVIVTVCGLVAFFWADKRKFGIWGKTATVLTVFFIAYAIPFGDHTIGMIKFKRLCNEEAGTKIYESAENVDGFAWDTGRDVKPFTTHGYSFYESIYQNNIYRYVLRKNGEVDEERVDTPRAKYFVRRNRNVQIEKYFKKSNFVILELTTDRSLAKHTTVHYAGGWLIRDLRGIGVGGSVCPMEPLNILDFIHAVLKPTKGRE